MPAFIKTPRGGRYHYDTLVDAYEGACSCDEVWFVTSTGQHLFVEDLTRWSLPGREDNADHEQNSEEHPEPADP